MHVQGSEGWRATWEGVCHRLQNVRGWSCNREYWEEISWRWENLDSRFSSTSNTAKGIDRGRHEGLWTFFHSTEVHPLVIHPLSVVHIPPTWKTCSLPSQNPNNFSLKCGIKLGVQDPTICITLHWNSENTASQFRDLQTKMSYLMCTHLTCIGETGKVST